MLEKALPGVSISAEHYPPSMVGRLASSVVTMAQWAVILCAFGGQTASGFAAGTPAAALVHGIQENKLAAAGGAWFVGSSLSASVLKTGAFEVQIRGAGEDFTVWSGMARGGRPPNTMQEMHGIVDALRTAGVGQTAPDLAPDPSF